MGKPWPALDVAANDDPDIVLAAADDFTPTAVEERDGALRIFFHTADARDRARAALSARFSVQPLDVDDEDWASRAQPGGAVVVGNVTVVSSLQSPVASQSQSRVTIVIPPSMGFGTGHHATTRLCLAALQAIDLRGKVVLDVGTGSGVLAIAASKLGAAHALGTDDDADAIQAANENIDANGVTNVACVVSDLMTKPLPRADVVLANITGAMIVRAASQLAQAVLPGGTLILSGILATERDEVLRAFANQTVVTLVQEDEWLGLTLQSPA